LLDFVEIVEIIFLITNDIYSMFFINGWKFYYKYLPTYHYLPTKVHKDFLKIFFFVTKINNFLNHHEFSLTNMKKCELIFKNQPLIKLIF